MTKNSRGFLMSIRKTGCEKYLIITKNVSNQIRSFTLAGLNVG
jgi:hypothetical protein